MAGPEVYDTLGKSYFDVEDVEVVRASHDSIARRLINERVGDSQGT